VVDDREHFLQQGVLVVDDCELMRLMMRLALERAGFRVLLANTGLEAIDIYRQHQSTIAAVLLDVQMPGMDGPRTLDGLRKVDPAVCTCFVSGDTGDYTPADLIRRGARAVFFKPFRIVDLADAVRRMANGEAPMKVAERSSELRSAAIFAEDVNESGIETTEEPALQL
jgi:CheY-like chemotaxis protein